MDITTQKDSLEYNIDKYSDLSFMQRNSIRYEFIKIFINSYLILFLCINDKALYFFILYSNESLCVVISIIIVI